MNAIVEGSFDRRFGAVADALAAAVADGEEVGAALAVVVNDEPLLDIWAGHADAARTIEWESQTIVNVWSSTKTVTSLAALIAVDRGLLDLTKPVAAYWPEFAENGKEDVEVRHVLSHTSGVSGWEPPFSTEDMYDWDYAVTRLAAQAPWWPPGSASGYHAHNQGHLVGELIRRVTGVTLKEYIGTEIAGPLGADFQLGARPGERGRIAQIISPPPLEMPLDQLPEDSPMRKTFSAPAPNAEAANTAAWREAELGALNGHGNARSLAQVLCAVAQGGDSQGAHLLSPATIDAIFDVQADGIDAVLGVPLRWGIGFGLPQRDTLSYVPEGRICFWGGWGGSMALIDTDRRATITYVMNKMGPGVLGSERTARYATLIYEALDA